MQENNQGEKQIEDINNKTMDEVKKEEIETE